MKQFTGIITVHFVRSVSRLNKPGRKWTEENRLRMLAKAIVEGKESGKGIKHDQTWRARAMRVTLQTVSKAPSRLATGKREVWEDWHSSLKRPDPEFFPYELFNLLRSKPNDFLQAILKQDRDRAHDLEKMMSRAYMTVQLIEYVLELRAEKKPNPW